VTGAGAAAPERTGTAAIAAAAAGPAAGTGAGVRRLVSNQFLRS